MIDWPLIIAGSGLYLLLICLTWAVKKPKITYQCSCGKTISNGDKYCPKCGVQQVETENADSIIQQEMAIINQRKEQVEQAMLDTIITHCLNEKELEFVKKYCQISLTKNAKNEHWAKKENTSIFELFDMVKK